MSNGIRPISLTAKGLERVRNVVERVETTPRSSGVDVQIEGRVPHAIKVKTPSGGIPAASSTSSPGSADCTIQYWSGTAWTAGSGTIKVYNPSSTTIAGNTPITILYVGGIWEANVVPC